MSVDYVLGVDAGNTKTIAMLATGAGEIVGVGRGGCGDIYGQPNAADSLAEIDRAVGEALRGAGADKSSILAGGFSLAGADWPEDYAFLQSSMASRGLGRKVVIVNDGVGALYAGLPGAVGVAVTCGTGAATAARNAEGAIWHSSFWQQGQGARDLSGYARRAIYRAALGLAPATALTDAALSHFGLNSVDEMLHDFTALHARPPANADALARVLLDTAALGDAVALRIVREEAELLGGTAVVAARKVGLEGSAFTLALAGGVLRHPSHLLAEAIIERVRQSSPDVVAINSRFEPVVGAIFLALDAAAIRLDETLLDRLEATLPPPTLFHTL